MEVWINSNPGLVGKKTKWCDAWLCPEEFSEQRTFALIEQSVGQTNPNALQELQRALRLDSASPYNWANLADVEMNAGHVDRARYCFQRAVAAAPLNPYILFRAANFDFQAGDQVGTLRLLRTVLKDPGLTSYYEASFLTYIRLDLPIEEVLEVGVPKAAPVAVAFLRYLMEANKMSQAQATWTWIVHNGLASDEVASDYVSFLLRNKELEEAANVWKIYTAKQFPEYRKTNWVYNGDFGREPTTSPLDWKVEKSKGFETSRIQNARGNGTAALLVKFLATDNLDFQQVSQTVVLGTGRWLLRGLIKTDNITTDQGIGLHLFEIDQPALLNWRSEKLVGTSDWRCLQTEFTVQRQTSLLKLEVVRQPSRKFDNKIGGSALIASVQLSRLE